MLHTECQLFSLVNWGQTWATIWQERPLSGLATDGTSNRRGNNNDLCCFLCVHYCTCYLYYAVRFHFKVHSSFHIPAIAQNECRGYKKKRWHGIIYLFFGFAWTRMWGSDFSVGKKFERSKIAAGRWSARRCVDLISIENPWKYLAFTLGQDCTQE